MQSATVVSDEIERTRHETETVLQQGSRGTAPFRPVLPVFGVWQYVSSGREKVARSKTRVGSRWGAA